MILPGHSLATVAWQLTKCQGVAQSRGDACLYPDTPGPASYSLPAILVPVSPTGEAPSLSPFLILPKQSSPGPLCRVA